ncbi:unnamed protein product [Urochloa humidicola]
MPTAHSDSAAASDSAFERRRARSPTSTGKRSARLSRKYGRRPPLNYTSILTTQPQRALVANLADAEYPVRVAMASGQTCTVSSDDVLEKVARINGKLASEKDGEAVLESLRQLQALPMTFEALETTKIGRAVNALRKSAPSDQARGLAAALYRAWKSLADEHFAARKATAPAAPTGDAAASANVAPKVDRSIARLSPTKAKPQSAGPNSSSAGSHRPMTTTRPSVVEAKLETTAMPAMIVKKQRSIRLVVKKAEPRPPVVQHRAVVLQTAVTTDPTPVSNSKPSGSNHKSSASTETASQQVPAVVKRVSPETSAASLTAKAKPPATVPKPSISGACKRKEAPKMDFDEARLARAKMRLHDGYKAASTVKEKRKIQVIATPGMGRPRPSQVRCTAVGGPGKRPPVPSCPRMSRAA